MSAITPDDRLVRPRWARLKRCDVRGQWLFLVPERVLYPCPQTTEVLMRLDAPTRFGDIVAGLAEEYDAPAEIIAADLAPLVDDLVEQGYVRRLDG